MFFDWDNIAFDLDDDDIQTEGFMSTFCKNEEKSSNLSASKIMQIENSTETSKEVNSPNKNFNKFSSFLFKKRDETDLNSAVVSYDNKSEVAQPELESQRGIADTKTSSLKEEYSKKYKALEDIVPEKFSVSNSENDIFEDTYFDISFDEEPSESEKKIDDGIQIINAEEKTQSQLSAKFSSNNKFPGSIGDNISKPQCTQLTTEPMEAKKTLKQLKKSNLEITNWSEHDSSCSESENSRPFERNSKSSQKDNVQTNLGIDSNPEQYLIHQFENKELEISKENSNNRLDSQPKLTQVYNAVPKPRISWSTNVNETFEFEDKQETSKNNCKNKILNEKIQKVNDIGTPPCNITNRYSIGNSGARKRKFPGPAGLLPEVINVSKSQMIDVPTNVSDKDTFNQDFLCSQASLEEFMNPSWQNLLKDFKSQSSDTMQDCIKNMLKKASKKKMPKHVEVQQFCAMLKDVSFKEDEVLVIFKDQSGEISGLIDWDVIGEYKEILKPGSSLVLQKATFLCNCLRVKQENLVAIYDREGTRTDIKKDFMKTFETSDVKISSSVTDPIAQFNSNLIALFDDMAENVLDDDLDDMFKDIMG